METSFIFSSDNLVLKSEGKNLFVEGYISTSHQDLVNDIVTEKCLIDMASQMRERTIKLDIEHESFRGKSEIDVERNKTIIPVAKIEDFLMDKKGLKVRAMLNPHNARFDEVKGSIQDGFIDAFSIAFVPVKDTIVERDSGPVRLLEKINLLNVAFTGNPINTHASIEKVFLKSLDFLEEKQLKKPKPQPDPHKEPEDDEEEKTKEKKKKELSVKYTYCKKCGSQLTEINNHGNDIIKLQEVKNMTEENKKALEVKDEVAEAKEEAVEPAEPKVEAEAEKPEESKDEPEAPAEVPKVDEEKEELKEEVKSLKEEVADIKSKMVLPIKKSIQSSEDKSKNFEEKSQNPLDLI